MTGLRFKGWLAERQMSYRDAGQVLGCSFAMVGFIARGEKLPGRRLASAIERATRDWRLGPIRPEEWDLEVKP